MSDIFQSIFSGLGKFAPYVLLGLILIGVIVGVVLVVGIAVNLKYILIGVGAVAAAALIYLIVKKVLAKKATS